jgi:hypothetical protein
MLSLDEIKVQDALGTLGDNVEFCDEIQNTTDLKIIEFIGIYSKNRKLRYMVALNINTPYSIIRHLYKYDDDYYNKQAAWNRVIQRYISRFGDNVPLMFKVRPFIHNLPCEYN